MARRTRIYYDHAVYHISIRGNNRQAVLEADEDKIAFLATLSKFKERFSFKLYGLVLMDNHSHLVVEANQTGNISKIMQAITLSYSQKFRHKYHYTGYVWQGRFKSNLIEEDRYIIDCIEYIHNNPVRAKMVEHPKDYPWSSYHFYNSDIDPLKDIIQIDRFSF
ncbi:MAG: transposase [Candidatus Omnitrophota bacterium]